VELSEYTHEPVNNDERFVVYSAEHPGHANTQSALTPVPASRRLALRFRCSLFSNTAADDARVRSRTGGNLMLFDATSDGEFDSAYTSAVRRPTTFLPQYPFLKVRLLWRQSFARTSYVIAHGVRQITRRRNRALLALTSALANARSDVLQILADTILDVIQCDSSGLSLLSIGEGGKRFRWEVGC
jgi:hypothetical protein